MNNVYVEIVGYNLAIFMFYNVFLCQKQLIYTELPITLTFCMCKGHDHNCAGTAGQGQKSRSNVLCCFITCFL